MAGMEPIGTPTETEAAPPLDLLWGLLRGACWSADGQLRITSFSGHGLEGSHWDGAHAVGTGVDAWLANHPLGESILELHQRALAGESCVWQGQLDDRMLRVRVEPALGADGRVTAVRAALLDDGSATPGASQDGRVAEAVNRRESLGRVAAAIAHDFNNKLLGILGNAELAQLDMGEQDPARERLRVIESTGMSSARLVQQILTYSGKQQVQGDLVHVGDLTRQMGELLRLCVSKGATLDINVSTNIPPVELNQERFRQVVLALVTNASESLDDGLGEVSLGLAAEQVEQSVIDGLMVGRDLPPGKYVVLRVEDSGTGIDARELERLFDPAYSTRGEGRGRGLAAVFHIVSGASGGIGIESSLGSGTKVLVLFPPAALPSGLKDSR